MATHSFTTTASEESIYQKYLVLAGLTEAQIMARVKQSVVDQVLQSINEAGLEKFKGLSVADKLTFLG